MKTFRSLPVLLLLLLLPASLVEAQDKAAQIDALLEKYHDLRQLNGAVLVAEDGEVIYKKGFGDAVMEWDVPNTPGTKFRIGSVTKQFTATLVLQLVEEGMLRLDGKITDYLPDYPKAQGDRVTVHQLLTHSSGIPSYTNLPGFMSDRTRDPYTPDSFLTVFSGLPLEFEPGSTFKYNNSGYFLLGALIEQVTGKPYDQVLRERILDPLGLDATGYEHNRDVIEHAALGYVRTPVGYEHAPYLDTSIPYAAGMMYSTVEDLYRWDQALYTDRIFKDPKSKELMFTRHIPAGEGHYGYGWFLHDLPLGDTGDTTQVIEHGGGIFGFTTAFKRLVDDRHVVVVMDNTANGMPGEIADNLIRILYSLPTEAPRTPISEVLGPLIEQEGVDAAIARYHALKQEEPDAYDFNEGELNRLGYYFLGNDQVDEALAVFKLNVEAYPEGFNTYDSLGEAYLEAGNEAEAIRNYQKSLELNPGNENARRVLKELGVDVQEPAAVELAPEVLDRYVGKYELRPGFVLTVTREDDQLMAQATGQPQVALFPQSETRFYVKEVNAQLAFHADGEGPAESLTLYQGGQEITGKRTE